MKLGRLVYSLVNKTNGKYYSYTSARFSINGSSIFRFIETRNINYFTESGLNYQLEHMANINMIDNMLEKYVLKCYTLTEISTKKQLTKLSQAASERVLFKKLKHI